MEAEASRRSERVARERRITNLVARVLTATGGRDEAVDEAVDEAGLRAGEALCEMTQDEALTLREAVNWLGASPPATPHGCAGYRPGVSRATHSDRTAYDTGAACWTSPLLSRCTMVHRSQALSRSAVLHFE